MANPSWGTLTGHGDHLGPCMACWNEGKAYRIDVSPGVTVTVTGRGTLTTCPCCREAVTGEPYDIGDGPEYSCPNCEWCWGALGQPLTQLSTAWMPDTDSD